MDVGLWSVLLLASFLTLLLVISILVSSEGLTMTSILFTITSVAFFVLLAHSVNQLSETY